MVDRGDATLFCTGRMLCDACACALAVVWTAATGKWQRKMPIDASEKSANVQFVP